MKHSKTELNNQDMKNKTYKDINESTIDKSDRDDIYLDKVDREVRFIKKITTGLVFISGGLFVLLMKNKADFKNIQKKSNE